MAQRSRGTDVTPEIVQGCEECKREMDILEYFLFAAFSQSEEAGGDVSNSGCCFYLF